MPGKDLCLLALDGGGIRGLSSLQILKQLMESTNPQSPPKPCDYFDMIGGTSTGGLIAIMLGRLSMSVDDCIEAYVSLSDKVFQKKKRGISILGNVQARFDSKELENAIKQVIEQQGLEVDAPLEDTPNTSCKVFVCAIHKETGKPVHLRSYWTPRGNGHNLRPKMWEAARATSAASSFFEPIKIGLMGQEFVDGATGANNPVYELWNEAQDVWKSAGRLDDNIKCLVSIGTGCPPVRPFGDNFVEIGRSLKALCTETEKTAESFARDKGHLIVEGRYFRFNVDKGLENISLEDSQQKNAVVSATSDYLESQEIYIRMQSFSLRSKSSAAPSGTKAYSVHAGIAAYHAKEWTQAITLLKQALEGECSLGLDSAQIRKYYAEALYLKGEKVSACHQFEMIVLWAEKEFGTEHDETLRSRMSWGYALEACHLSIPAGKQYKLAALGFERASNNVDTLNSLRSRYRHGKVASEHEAYDLAWPYWVEAEESLRRAAEGFARLLKPENDEAFEAQKGYATVLLKMCRDKDALIHFNSLLLVATQKRRPRHEPTIMIIKRNINECEFWLRQPLVVRMGDRLPTARKRAQKQRGKDNWRVRTGW